MLSGLQPKRSVTRRKALHLFAIVCLSGSLALPALEPGKFYTRGDSSKKRIALSFDDGPGPETPKFLAMLDRYGVKATFFVLGQAVSTHEDLVKDMVRRGHEVASHTTSHRNYLSHYKKLTSSRSTATATRQAQQDLVQDMTRAQTAIRRACGVQVSLCRMPHGVDRPWIKAAAREAGVALVNWTYGADWQPGTAQQLLPGYLNAIQPGAILLFHDGGRNRTKSHQLAEAVIREALNQGYAIVTVGEMLGGGKKWNREFAVDSTSAP